MPIMEVCRVTPIPTKSLFYFRSITLNPTVNGGVIDIHAPFGQHFLAGAIFTVPAHYPQYDNASEMTIFKCIHAEIPSSGLFDSAEWVTNFATVPHIKTGGDACDGMATVNNLFDRFNFELFKITFTAH